MKYRVIKETDEFVDAVIDLEDPDRGPRTVRFFLDEDGTTVINILAFEHGRTFGLEDYFTDNEINWLWTLQV